MGNSSSGRNVIPNRVSRDVVNNNAYYLYNERQAQSQFNSMESLWSRQQKLREDKPQEVSYPANITELSNFMGKATTLVDLSDTSTLTISSDEISSRSSSETLNPRMQMSKRHQSTTSEKRANHKPEGDGGGDKSISDQSLHNIETISAPSNQIPSHQISHLLKNNGMREAPMQRKTVKDQKQQPNITTTSTAISRQSMANLRNSQSLNRLSQMPRPGTRLLNHPVIGSEPNSLSGTLPQSPRHASHGSSHNRTMAAAKSVRDNQLSKPRNVKQHESHNSNRMQISRSESASTLTGARHAPHRRNLNNLNDRSHFKHVSHSNSSINFLSSSPKLRKPFSKGYKSNSNLRPILISSQDSSQPLSRSWVSNPRLCNRSNLRSPAPNMDSIHKPVKSHGLRKITDMEYQKYNTLINDFRYQMKAQRSRRDMSCDSRSSSLDRKMSSTDNLRSMTYDSDDTDDETYSFPVSTTHVRPPSAHFERECRSREGRRRDRESPWSTHLKSTTSSSSRASRPPMPSNRLASQRHSDQSYVVEIKGNIKQLKRREPDSLAVYCYKFMVFDGVFMQKMLANNKDRRIETICRQSSCRIHVKRRWLRHASQPPFYEIIVFAREIQNIEKCCTLFNIMFPSFNAEAGLGY